MYVSQTGKCTDSFFAEVNVKGENIDFCKTIFLLLSYREEKKEERLQKNKKRRKVTKKQKKKKGSPAKKEGRKEQNVEVNVLFFCFAPCYTILTKACRQ